MSADVLAMRDVLTELARTIDCAHGMTVMERYSFRIRVFILSALLDKAEPVNAAFSQTELSRYEILTLVSNGVSSIRYDVMAIIRPKQEPAHV